MATCMNQNPYWPVIFDHTTCTAIIIVLPVFPLVPVEPWIFQSENVICGKLYLPVSITHILQNIPNPMSSIIRHRVQFSAA